MQHSAQVQATMPATLTSTRTHACWRYNPWLGGGVLPYVTVCFRLEFGMESGPGVSWIQSSHRKIP